VAEGVGVRSLSRSLSPTDPQALSLIPWAAFVLVLLVDGWVTDGPVSLVGVVPGSVLYLAFVALPCLFPLTVAPSPWLRYAVALVMSAVAVFAAVAMISSEDAQAGLIVFVVTYVAVPLGGAIWVTREVVASRRR
jgi:hypothetical protein